jgi:hypothetical protein
MIVNSHLIRFTFLIEATIVVMGEGVAIKGGVRKKCCPIVQQSNRQTSDFQQLSQQLEASSPATQNGIA